MSVVKSKRSQSKIEFEQLYFQVADGVDTLVEHNACHKTLRKMDLLYKSLFPQSEPQKRKSRNKLCKDIYVDANKNDLNTIINF